MHRTPNFAAALLTVAFLSAPAIAATPATTPAQDYPIRPVPFTDVHLTSGFWADRIETNRRVTIPFAFAQCEKNGRMYNFERAAAALRGELVTDTKPSEFPFDDTDVYKVIEGASYAMAAKPDPAMDAYVDKLIVGIAAAQEPDGYLYTARTISPDHPHAWAGPQRWVLERELSHELYDFGHLAEAATAHYQATGKRTLLDVALKFADLLDRTFGPGKQAIWPGHQIAEMGLVKLYRVTGEQRYLNLAKFLLDSRGPDGKKGSGTPYNQSHEPVTQQREAVGHAVRATYMYSGMADVAAMTGDAAYLAAIDAIWQNVVDAKLYVTGGIGATSAGEAFGANYELPNMTAYNETCAAIGNVYWNQRLFLLHGDAKYVDVLERTLYNGLISGVNLDGDRFFYPNPLESKGQFQRSPWFGCACCPSNICRFMASVPGYVYAQRQGVGGDDLYVNLFATGTATLKISDGTAVTLVQQTDYPWDGAIKINVDPAAPATFALNVRVPGWARDTPVPSDLYAFEGTAEPATLKVNGRATPLDVKAGYARVERRWQAGDTVELDLPMPVRRVTANAKVRADVGRVALQRGPIVYCVEWPDAPGGKVRDLLLHDDAAVRAGLRPDMLRGVVALKLNATACVEDKAGRQSATDVVADAIPYYAWAQRGPGEMQVWLAKTAAAVVPAKPATIASTARVTTSGGSGSVAAINDGNTPKSSDDESDGVFHWWPKKGTTEWVEYAFAEPERVSRAGVYWFDDTGHGECRVPAGWRLLYKDTAAGASGAWVPVRPANGSIAGTKKDADNILRFAEVTTTALRLEVDLQPGWAGGVIEWWVK